MFFEFYLSFNFAIFTLKLTVKRKTVRKTVERIIDFIILLLSFCFASHIISNNLMSNSIFICFCEHFSSHYNTVWSVTAFKNVWKRTFFCHSEHRKRTEN